MALFEFNRKTILERVGQYLAVFILDKDIDDVIAGLFKFVHHIFQAEKVQGQQGVGGAGGQRQAQTQAPLFDFPEHGLLGDSAHENGGEQAKDQDYCGDSQNYFAAKRQPG